MNTHPSMTQTLSQAVKKDPYKAGMLAFLALVLLVVLARVMLPSSNPVRRAIAAATGFPDAKDRDAEVRRSREFAGKDEFEKFLAAPVAPISRNIFSVKLEYFPSDGSGPSQHTGTGGEKNSGDALAKLLTEQADQETRKEVLIENLRQQAGQLKLQSTFMGAAPRALINGELLGEGEVIASFRILRIEARRVILEREGIKLEISMN